MILLCPPEKSTQFHYPLDPKKIPAEGSIHKDTTYQGSDRQDFYRHGKKKKRKKENKQTKRRPRLGLPIGNPVNSDNLLLDIEKVKTYTTLGDRAFQVAAPKLWNNLPFNIRSSLFLPSFKKALKTYLLREAFP